MSPAARGRLAVLLGGAGGTAARIGVGDAFDTGAAAWPWATLLVNLSGALALPLLGTGLLGALTTFSALSLEVYLLGDAGRVGLAFLYVAVTVAGGLAAAISGTVLAERR